jgi:hypothetical protein
MKGAKAPFVFDIKRITTMSLRGTKQSHAGTSALYGSRLLRTSQ